MKKTLTTLLAGAFTAVASFALADGHGFKPAVIYDMGGKFDQSCIGVLTHLVLNIGHVRR